MHRRVFHLSAFFTLFMLTAAVAGAHTILWDHPAPSTVSGYAVVIDGVRTDHALRVAGANGACSCSLTVTLAPGTHTVAVAAYNARGETRSSPVSITVPAGEDPAPPPPSATLPTGWTSQDIGSTGLSGNTSYSSGAFTVAAAGRDVWGAEDSFHYVHTALTADGTITARVQSLQNTSSIAKAGLMMRASTAPGSQNVTLNVMPSGAIEFMSRRGAGSSTTFIAGDRQAAPTWLRLQRTGTAITGQVSADGRTWRTVGTVTVSGLTRAGLFVVSGDPNARNTAGFNSVTLNAAASGPSDIVIYAADVPTTALRGVWSRSSSSSAAANVKLTTTNVGAANNSAPLASPRDYVDITFNAVANTPYTLWMRIRARDDDKYNDSLWVQFSNARVNGSRVFPIGSTSGLLVNLATSSDAADLSGWGWQNGVYWHTQPRTFTFGTTGPQTMRVQLREDGIELDQIVLSPSRYLNTSPGQPSDDTTIVPR